MHTLSVSLAERGYPIHIGDGLLQRADLLTGHLPQNKVAIVSNNKVAALYLAALQAALAQCGVDSIPVILPDGEEYKNWQTLNSIFDALLAGRCERNTAIIALGGGVIGDLAGFAAATYQRGVPFIQVPTTLLAQVDSSVGGKTGINHPLGKNMIGAFYQPRLVLTDTATLNTLPDRELRAGVAEVIKYGLIRDLPFFEWLDQNMEKLLAREPEALSYAILRSCQNKADIVAQDERECGVRALLNLGHTFGHAIEKGLGYGTWLHGEAVAAGMRVAAELSHRLGCLDAQAVRRIIRLIERAKLPTEAPDLGVELYLQLMGLDKKVSGGKIRFIVLNEIGQATIRADIPDAILRATLTSGVAHA